MLPHFGAISTRITLLSQRIYALALGHEDLNDHGELRHDLALQTATDRVAALASPSTLCRLEQRADRETTWAILSLLVKALRAHWPKVKIVFRGDSGFCRWRMPRWCDSH